MMRYEQELTFLKPGQLIITCTPKYIHTILGSCVSVCLWDETSGCAGINHFLLPESNKKELSFTFGGHATSQLIVDLRSVASKKACIVAKIFGGGNILPEISPIGDDNVLAAKKVLAAHNIQIIAEETGGKSRRKIIFDTKTGKVHLFSPNKGWKWI